MQSLKPERLTVKYTFIDSQYTIPIYQRNYSWGIPHVSQLVQDIWDNIDSGKPYYIGTLVVFNRKKNTSIIYEVIDGQQRLTTLNILLSVLKKQHSSPYFDWFKLNLNFDSRPNSSRTLEVMYDENIRTSNFDENDFMLTAYQTIENKLNQLRKNSNTTIEQFTNYLLNQVILFRVSVPDDTDLNHYFEIMNNRGEQLEKHEILKAKMLSILKDEPTAKRTFNKIWVACSDMETYVQYRFDKNEREQIFKEYTDLKVGSFDKLITILGTDKKKGTDQDKAVELQNLLIDNIIVDNNTETQEKEDARFNTIINFSNFLLQVLRIQAFKDENFAKEDIVPLDDKRLITTFTYCLEKTKDQALFVKEFGYKLLYVKYLFDKYIIKREIRKDEWSLKRLKWNKQSKSLSYVNTFGQEDDTEDSKSLNKQILMLLSMFHVSTPTLVYKHWLNGALDYLFSVEKISSEDYSNFLEKMSDAFFFERFATAQPKDYFEIIYLNECELSNSNSQIKASKLHDGTGVENFIFNRLDYLLWKKGHGSLAPEIINKFQFSFRTSVEHYYPQNPLSGQRKLAADDLNHFGNLCLISRSKNSKLNNYMPTAKKEHYTNNPVSESLKQRIMMEVKEKWEETAISEHGEEMIEVLKDGY
jgi:uncharacterized protein with ParB-like and HNH nuclease domain